MAREDGWLGRREETQERCRHVSLQYARFVATLLNEDGWQPESGEGLSYSSVIISAEGEDAVSLVGVHAQCNNECIRAVCASGTHSHR